MKKLINEFKEFAIKGNVMDMAVGVIIGGAFGKIITSLVNDIIMPAISLITGRINISELALSVNFGEDKIDINYGIFLQNALDFLLVALCVFIIIKMINIFRKKQVEEPKAADVSNEEALLTEIRDILKEGKE